MPTAANRILLVDDDDAFRQLVERALAAEGFVCDQAKNGADAASLMDVHRYDLLLTDLQMPSCNGHALAVAALARTKRPLIVVLTGVAEPRLAADLLVRGVDDVIFKPIAFRLLAIKLKALLASRRLAKPPSVAAAAGVSAADLEDKLLGVSHALPVSAAAIEVARMAADQQFSAQQIAVALGREAALAVEVLRLANSQYFAASAAKTANLEEAAVRVGLRRVGEIALATSALNGIVDRSFPWMNIALLSQQSIAAGMALRLLIQRAGISDDGGLFLSALTHGLGRVVLGTLYPEIYEQLSRTCAAGDTLLDREDRVFPYRHAQVMAQLLAKWGVQPSACVPLRHTLSTYEELESLNEPLRSKVEVCKLAILMGRVAVGQWEPWDVIEPTPGPIVARLGLRSLDDILEQTLCDLQNVRPRDTAAELPAPQSSDGAGEKRTRYAGYVTLSSSRGDLLPSILASLGVKVHPLKPESLAVEEHVIVNCLGVPSKRLAPFLGSGLFPTTRCIITDSSHFADYQAMAATIVLPGGVAALRDACRAVAADSPLAHVG